MSKTNKSLIQLIEEVSQKEEQRLYAKRTIIENAVKLLEAAKEGKEGELIENNIEIVLSSPIQKITSGLGNNDIFILVKEKVDKDEYRAGFCVSTEINSALYVVVLKKDKDGKNYQYIPKKGWVNVDI